jgi:4-oxalocrotonate tautomerase
LFGFDGLYCSPARAAVFRDFAYRATREFLKMGAGTMRINHLKESDMPTIRVELMEGRTPEQKKNLVQALTQAVVDTLGSKPESVDVLLFDVKRSDWATGGQLWSERK